MIDANIFMLILLATSIFLILFWTIAIRLILKTSKYKIKLIIHGVIFAGYIFGLLPVIKSHYGLVSYSIMVAIFTASHAFYIIY